MDYTQEFFSSELVMPRLLEWFNALPDLERSVDAGSLFIVRVKVLTNQEGEPTFAIGLDPTIDDPTRTYIGESVYLWIGPAGTNLVATESSFFELSKFIKSGAGDAMVVIPFNGTAYVAGETVETIVRRMAYGFNYDTYSDGNTFALSGDGSLEYRSGAPYYMGPDTDLKFVSVATGGQGWGAGITEAGELYTWGSYWSISNHNSSEPMQYTINDGTRAAIQIAALNESLIVLLEDGTLWLIGSNTNLPGDTSGNFSAHMEMSDINSFSNVKDIRSFYKIYDHPYENNSQVSANLLFVIGQDNSVVTWGAVINDVNGNNGSPTLDSSLLGEKVSAGQHPGNIIKVVGDAKFGAALYDTGFIFTWSEGYAGLDMSYSYSGTGPGETSHIDMGLTASGLFGVLKDNGEFWWTENEWSNPYWEMPFDNAKLMGAGEEDLVIINNDNEAWFYQDIQDGAEDTIEGNVVAVFVGHQHERVALLSDGSLYWWARVYA